MNTNSSFVAIVQHKTNHIQVSPGNITPNEWYQQFTNNRGTPDLALISVLSEIVYWYRPKRNKDSSTGAITYVNKFLGDAWQTSYEHFEKKFGFNREKLRRIFVKLEQMGICAREFRNVKLRGQTYNNRLFIHLNSELLNSYTTHKEKKSNLENKNTDSNTSFFAPEEEGGSPHFEGDHIIDIKNNIIIKDRSIKSNFFKNSFEEKKIEEASNHPDSSGLEKGRSVSDQHRGIFTKAKELKDFYPLSQVDCSSLQATSKRNFSLRAMNEILLDMSKRLKDKIFYSKKGFMSYMSKVFVYEKRNPLNINNDSFRIRNNRTKEEIDLQEQEKFLAKIEYSLQVSPEWHLKKKLACVLSPAKSYELLRAYRGISRDGSVFTIHLDQEVELTRSDKEIILNQVKATHEIIDFDKDEITMIDKLEIQVRERPFFKGGGVRRKDIKNMNHQDSSTVIPDNMWGRIRKNLISTIYKNGEAVDRNWFSRLEAQVNEESKTIHLRAPSDFYRDWIKQNYLELIERISEAQEYRVSLV